MAGWDDLISGFTSLFSGGGEEFVDPWDPQVMGDPSMYGLFNWGDTDNWDPALMGDLDAYGLPDWVRQAIEDATPAGDYPTTTSAQALMRLLSTGSGGGTGGGGNSLLRLLGGLGGGLASLFGNGGGNGLTGLFGSNGLLPGLAGLFTGLQDSDKYMKMAEEASPRFDPFSSQRGTYQELLKQLATDPQSYLQNDPGYQSTLKLALNPVESKMRSMGYGNSGNMLTELTKVSGDVTNKYLGEMMDRFGKFGGAQFGPEAAANLYGQGIRASVDARNGGLASLFAGLNGPGSSNAITNGLNGLGNWFSNLFNDGNTYVPEGGNNAPSNNTNDPYPDPGLE